MNHRFALLVPVTAVVLALTSARAQAQTVTPSSSADTTTEDDTTVELSVFEVSTERDVGYQAQNAAEVTRMNTAIEDLPMNVTVFNQQFIDDLLATESTELLAYEASSVKTTENDGFLARGSTSVGTNFLNGFAQTSGFGSQLLANIERVEVIRGPAAVLYGSGGYGGTYNRITKQPRPKASGSFRTIMSDGASFRTEFDYNAGGLPFWTNDKLLFRVNGIYEDGETWFGQRKGEKGIAPSLAWNISKSTKLILEYFYDWRDTQASWETPVHNGDPLGMTVGDGTYLETPRKIAWVYPDDYRHNTRQVASYDFRHMFTRNLQFRSQFQWETKKQENKEVQAMSDSLTILADTALMPIRWRYWPRDTDNYRSRNELVWQFEALSTKHRVLVGHAWNEQYDLNRQYLSCRNNGGITNTSRLYGSGKLTDSQAGSKYNSYPDLTYAEFLADPHLAGFNTSLLLPINIFNRAAETALAAEEDRPPLYLNTHTKTYTANQDVYINDVFSFAHDRFFIMAGGRYCDTTKRTISFVSGTFPNKVLLDASPTTVVDADATTSSFGVVYHLNEAKTFTLYANLNSSFSPVYQVNPEDGPDLEPERGNQKEIGLRFSLNSGRITGLVTYFDLLQDNVTESDPERDGYYIQIHGERSSGYELSLNARMTDNWLVFGGYSYTDARNDITGVPTELQPKNRLTMFNRFNFTSGSLKGFGLSLGAIYTGERPLTNATSRSEPDWGPMPDYWKVDVIANYKLRPKNAKLRYELSLKISNLFDNQEIYYVGSYFRYTIDPGRQWQFSGGVRF